MIVEAERDGDGVVEVGVVMVLCFDGGGGVLVEVRSAMEGRCGLMIVIVG